MSLYVLEARHPDHPSLVMTRPRHWGNPIWFKPLKMTLAEVTSAIQESEPHMPTRHLVPVLASKYT